MERNILMDVLRLYQIDLDLGLLHAKNENIKKMLSETKDVDINSDLYKEFIQNENEMKKMRTNKENFYYAIKKIDRKYIPDE